MKRLKITLLAILILFALSVVAIANEVTKKSRSFFDSSFFRDESLQSAVEHFRSNLNDLSTLSLGVIDTQWEEDAKGRTLFITTKDKDQKIDLKIENEMIEIKSVQEKKTQNMQSQSMSSHLVSVPDDCDANRALITPTDSGLKVFLPYREAQKIKKIKVPQTPQRIPLKVRDGDIEV